MPTRYSKKESDVVSMVRSAIQQMTGYVPGEQPAAGVKVVKLNTNENPYPCSPKVTAAIRHAAEGGLQKYPDPLAMAFRIRAGEVLGVEPDWILSGNGSDDILTILTRTFVGEGDSIQFAYPSYVLYRTLAEIQGARSREIPFQCDWSFSPPPRPSPSEGEGDRLRLVFLANPNSPSGTIVRPDRVAELAAALPCPLVVDEAYVDFADVNCLPLVAANENVIVTRTLSKSYALAGLRFGFVVAQPQVIEQLAKVKDSYNCDALSIAGAAAAVDDQAWLVENRAKIVATRTRLADQLGRLGFDIAPSQANFVWATRKDRPVRPIYERLKQDGILVRYLDYAGWGDGLRVTVGTDGQVDAFLAILEGIL